MSPEAKPIMVSMAPMPAGMAISSVLSSDTAGAWTSRRAALRKGDPVLPHDEPTVRVGIVEVLEVLDVADGIGQAFGMWIVRAHQDVICPEHGAQGTQLVLVVRRYPY